VSQAQPVAESRRRSLAWKGQGSDDGQQQTYLLFLHYSETTQKEQEKKQKKNKQPNFSPRV
jgi:hypothetical protein